MYYIKIPLAHLVSPSELNVPEEQKQSTWDARVKSLLTDIRAGHIPSWAVSYKDLEQVKIEGAVEALA